MPTPRWYALALVVVATACSSAQACSDVGCISQIQVDVRPYVAEHPGITEIRVCANDSCRTFPPGRSGYSSANPWRPRELTLPTGKGNQGKIEVKLTIDAPAGRTTASTTTTLRVLKPNGPNCSPTCYLSDLRLSATRELGVISP